MDHAAAHRIIKALKLANVTERDVLADPDKYVRQCLDRIERMNGFWLRLTEAFWLPHATNHVQPRTMVEVTEADALSCKAVKDIFVSAANG